MRPALYLPRVARKKTSPKRVATRGRKPLPPEKKRSVLVALKLTPGEAARLDEAAEGAGLRRCDVVRDALDLFLAESPWARSRKMHDIDCDLDEDCSCSVTQPA